MPIAHLKNNRLSCKPTPYSKNSKFINLPTFPIETLNSNTREYIDIFEFKSQKTVDYI